jgi:hypothetical protein
MLSSKPEHNGRRSARGEEPVAHKWTISPQFDPKNPRPTLSSRVTSSPGDGREIISPLHRHCHHRTLMPFLSRLTNCLQFPRRRKTPRSESHDTKNEEHKRRQKDDGGAWKSLTENLPFFSIPIVLSELTRFN